MHDIVSIHDLYSYGCVYMSGSERDTTQVKESTR